MKPHRVTIESMLLAMCDGCGASLPAIAVYSLAGRVMMCDRCWLGAMEVIAAVLETRMSDREKQND